MRSRSSLKPTRPFPIMSDASPCLSCGACCKTFRVSFYWAEGDDAPGGHVPSHLTNQLNIMQRCMKGTDSSEPHCIALMGTVGEGVRCTIYESRPSPCRDFAMSGEGGVRNEACDRARARFGLPPLPVDPDTPNRIPVIAA